MNRPSAPRLAPWAWILATLSAGTALAQQVPPTSGQLLQQARPQQSVAPGHDTGLTIQAPGERTATDTTPFAVNRIEISGNTLFSTGTLHALVADGEGQHLTLAALETKIQRIGGYYRAHGYPLSRAVIPAQTLRDGVVKVSVVEARYDHVQITNHSTVSDRLLQATLAPLRAGEPVEQTRLDERLLLLDDLPGVQGHALLRPGSQPGTTDLLVDAKALPAVTGNLTLDDAGDRYTGRTRLGGNIIANNLAGLGDQLSVSALTAGHDMRYGRLGYELAVSGSGARVGASYSALGYRLGDDLSALHARGSATDSSLWVTQSFIRSPDANVGGRLQVDDRRLHDAVDSVGIRNDRHSLDWTASVMADRRDGWGGGGVTTGTLSVTRGQLHFDNAVAGAADAATAGTQGTSTRWNGSVSRLQSLAGTTRLWASLRGQYANHNLDSSEQLLLGGVSSLRGYDTSVLAGASGYLATLELRHDFALPAGQWQGTLFVDHGGVWINPHPWAGVTGSNHASLSSVGVGLNWAGDDQWTAQVQVSQPVGHSPELAGRHASPRAWVQLSKGFY
jgi:hemolysin activation/secretion protein